MEERRERQLSKDNNPIIESFYNELAASLMLSEDLNASNFNGHLRTHVQEMIVRTIFLSSQLADIDGIRMTPEGQVIIKDNCPLMYLNFLTTILKLIPSVQPTAETTFDSLNKTNKGLIGELATKLMETPAFKAMLPKLQQFILESRHSMRYLDDEGITVELIRETFYNEMVAVTLQAIEQGLIRRSDLAEEETYIYLGLPGLTLIEAILKSKDCYGIEMLNRKVVSNDNCPKDPDNKVDFPRLVETILIGKALMQSIYGDNLRIPEDELMVIKYLCLAKDTEMPDELLKHKTEKAVSCVGAISEMSEAISQSKVFHEMILFVIQACLETLPESLSNGM